MKKSRLPSSPSSPPNRFLRNLDRVAEGLEPQYADTPMKKLPLREPPRIMKKELDRKRRLEL